MTKQARVEKAAPELLAEKAITNAHEKYRKALE